MKRIWTSKELLVFSSWLYNNHSEYYLLCIHGITLGLKIGTQLDLKWSDFINDDNTPKNQVKGRKINERLMTLNKTIFSNHEYKLTDNVYIGKRTGEKINTSNLSKTLQTYSKQYMIECGINPIELEVLTSSSFQASWCLDMVRQYNYSKKAYLEVARHIGKRTVKELEQFILVKASNNEIEMRYDHVFY
jgi:hypothetical protein